MVTALATLSAREPRTARLLEPLGRHCPDILTHGLDVAVLGVRVAHVMGLREPQLTLIARAALLHDVGKQHVPLSILAKPAELTALEWEIMRRHPVSGHRMLIEAGFVEEAQIVLHHHERVDGRGYPAGRSGDRIPLEARLLAVADAFDAMTADRPYRSPASRDAALDELRRVAGRQLDTECVEALTSFIERGRV